MKNEFNLTIYTETCRCRLLLAEWINLRDTYYADKTVNELGEAVKGMHSDLKDYADRAYANFEHWRSQYGNENSYAVAYINLRNALTQAITKANDLIGICRGGYADKALVDEKIDFVCRRLRWCIDLALEIDDLNDNMEGYANGL